MRCICVVPGGAFSFQCDTPINSLSRLARVNHSDWLWRLFRRRIIGFRLILLCGVDVEGRVSRAGGLYVERLSLRAVLIFLVEAGLLLTHFLELFEDKDDVFTLLPLVCLQLLHIFLTMLLAQELGVAPVVLIGLLMLFSLTNVSTCDIHLAVSTLKLVLGIYEVDSFLL